jgi:lysophospholipase L1-like esterase
VWHDAKNLTIEGRGWNDTEDFYFRLPARAKSKVNDSVWWLAGDSAGMVVRFITDSTEIRVKWSLRDEQLAMEHMAATGVSGVDLYTRYNGKWRWLGVGKPSHVDNESTLIEGMPAGKREFALYLPLYNGVKSVEIGILEGATIGTAAPRTRDIKPIVFYGTSITQGGCASRPGMAYTAIIGRALDAPIINLGFSGSGKCEPEVADLLAELDPQVYVIDCLPNMEEGFVDTRIRYLLKVLKEHHPDTPVILVENIVLQNTYIFGFQRESKPKNDVLKKLYDDVRPEWGDKLSYVPCTRLYGTDGEATVDGVHATDLGFSRMAQVLTPAVKKALENR